MNKAILRLAIPNILSNISIPLLSAVDVALMGGLSIVHLGAIGLATMIFNFFFWNFGFLRMGTTGLVSQAHGARDGERINEILSQAIYFGAGISIFIILLQLPIGYLAQIALGISEVHQNLVWEYFTIRVWAAPASLLTYCLFGYLFGRQNAVFPLIVTIIVNLLNIVLSYILVIHYNMEIRGAAIGTLVAEYLGVILLLIFIFRKYQFRLLHINQLNNWSRFLRVNRHLFVRTTALTSAFAFFYRESSMSGELILATNVVILQFLSWMSYGIDGFAFASESLVGMYLGEKNREKLLNSVRLSFKWGLGLAIIFGLLFSAFGENISRIFTSDILVLQNIIAYRWWLFALPLVAFSCYIWDGIFIGLTQTSEMRDSMIISLVIYALSYWLLSKNVDNAIWLSFIGFLSVRGILLTVYWVNIRGKLLNKIDT